MKQLLWFDKVEEYRYVTVEERWWHRANALSCYRANEAGTYRTDTTNKKQ